jgi:hypothetical protein
MVFSNSIKLYIVVMLDCTLYIPLILTPLDNMYPCVPVLGRSLFRLFLFFESLAPEWQIETLRASRGSAPSDNLHLVVLIFTLKNT